MSSERAPNVDRIHEQHLRLSVARDQVHKVAKKIVFSPGDKSLLVELSALGRCVDFEEAALKALIEQVEE